MPCRVVDISETGAKLRPGWGGALPDRLDLRDMFTDIHRAVVVVWRGLGGIGVRFLDRYWERNAPTGFGRRQSHQG
jgi:hypothetical protein